MLWVVTQSSAVWAATGFCQAALEGVETDEMFTEILAGLAAEFEVEPPPFEVLVLPLLLLLVELPDDEDAEVADSQSNDSQSWSARAETETIRRIGRTEMRFIDLL